MSTFLALLGGWKALAGALGAAFVGLAAVFVRMGGRDAQRAADARKGSKVREEQLKAALDRPDDSDLHDKLRGGRF